MVVLLGGREREIVRMIDEIRVNVSKYRKVHEENLLKSAHNLRLG